MCDQGPTHSSSAGLWSFIMKGEQSHNTDWWIQLSLSLKLNVTHESYVPDPSSITKERIQAKWDNCSKYTLCMKMYFIWSCVVKRPVIEKCLLSTDLFANEYELLHTVHMFIHCIRLSSWKPHISEFVLCLNFPLFIWSTAFLSVYVFNWETLTYSYNLLDMNTRSVYC